MAEASTIVTPADAMPPPLPEARFVTVWSNSVSSAKSKSEMANRCH